MASTADEENDAVLSDVEGDDPVPIDIKVVENLSAERFRELLVELDRERLAREAAENAKNDLQVSINRLKALCHEAIRKRDECFRQRDEALREKNDALAKLEKVSGELSAAEIKLREDALKQKEDVARQLEEVRKERESMRIELETGSSMLVSGTEKISRKVSNYADFGGVGLPKSSKYSGLPSVAYGVIKRTNEIVEELLRHIDLNVKSRNEARDLVEQRNYEIAIEVSQLESTISGLRDEVSKKSEEVVSIQRSMDEKDEKLAELEKEFSERKKEREIELSRLSLLVSEYESNVEIQKPLLIDQLNHVSKIHGQMCEIMKIVEPNESSNFSESLFVAEETNAEESIRASLAGLVSVHELSSLAAEKIRGLIAGKNREVRTLNESISSLVKEKEQIGSLLRSTFSKRLSADLSSETNRLFKVAENGLREAGIDYEFSKIQPSKPTAISDDKEENEVYALASALENIIKQSQLEIIELKHSVDELRTESNVLKEHAETQMKELNAWKQRVAELEENERMANENVEGLLMDISAAEEEIARWKMAAQQEAEAGKAVEQQCLSQLASMRQELEEARQAVIEAEKKLNFKEQTAEAAMAARDAAEKSLRLADTRASKLRDRVEELTRHLEELDGREISRTIANRPRYVCWPWQWLGLDFVGSQRPETPSQNTNEMELSEPFL